MYKKTSEKKTIQKKHWWDRLYGSKLTKNFYNSDKDQNELSIIKGKEERKINQIND